MSALTWLRTNKGPSNSWLHRIGKSDSPACPDCHHHSQDGDHITFHCPAHNTARGDLLRGRTTWEELDQDLYLQDHPDDEAYEATEEFFSYLFTHIRTT